MKKFVYVAVIGFLLISCGGGDDPAPTPKNEAPTVPTLVAPANNKLCVDNLVSFQWNVSADSNNDPITYQIQVAKDNQFLQIVKTLEDPTNSQNISLEKGVAYYWRVKATDNKSLSSDYSSVYNFYTEGEAVVNHLPFSPELVQPVLNTVLNTATATLKWNASDVDVNDILVFDVYFGTDNPPISKVSENLATNTLDVLVVPSKEYYWKVVVKDGKGGETIGQTWKFKTN
ncbi:hypothetical protein ACM55F_13435 [Flavobacterium sp. XS2P12]|uniref:hypothetical protein n=1 Tax=Flavobacterium melibiosi TaxID=3398734 RepID=UPI003A84AF58